MGAAAAEVYAWAATRAPRLRKKLWPEGWFATFLVGLKSAATKKFLLAPMLPLQDAFDMSMITATSWVPRGFAAPFPQKYVFDDGEFERISQLARLQLDDAKEDLDEAKNGGKSADEEEEPQSNAAAISGVKDDMYACAPTAIMYPV